MRALLRPVASELQFPIVVEEPLLPDNQLGLSPSPDAEAGFAASDDPSPTGAVSEAEARER